MSQFYLDCYWLAVLGTFMQATALASNWLMDFANYTPMEKNSD
jgi:hypothetical protein